ncbi:MAG TPA: DUF3551 domain-containing protein [Pseudolabrys sp.]|nr:DUF3551 domain-containing protein [Pseudolabrys sp.]
MSITRIAITILVFGAFLVPIGAGAYEQPYEPYPWCAVYSGDAGGASNCGFTTIEQCRATVSGIGGSCEPNQFYNPHRPVAHHRKKHRD